MAAILASNSCYCPVIDLMNQGRVMDNLSFSSSISTKPFAKFERQICNPQLTEKFRFEVEMRQTESPPPRLGSTGRAVKMVPVSEVMKRRKLNGTKVEIVNGTKQVINGARIVKRDSSTALVKSPTSRKTDKLPPLEDLPVPPSDEGFSWANENYNNWQRTIDVWSFVLSLRVRVLFDNAKWAYLGGFTEDKQVSFLCCAYTCLLSTNLFHLQLCYIRYNYVRLSWVCFVFLAFLWSLLSRKAEGKKLLHGYGSVYCSLVQLLSN